MSFRHPSPTEQFDLVMRYLGKPWYPCCCGPDAYDCKGLVAALFADNYQISVKDALDGFTNGSSSLERIQRPETLSIVLMTAREGLHVGVWLDADGGGVLHSVCGLGVVYTPSKLLKNYGISLTAFYRVDVD